MGKFCNSTRSIRSLFGGIRENPDLCDWSTCAVMSRIECTHSRIEPFINQRHIETFYLFNFNSSLFRTWHLWAVDCGWCVCVYRILRWHPSSVKNRVLKGRMKWSEECLKRHPKNQNELLALFGGPADLREGYITHTHTLYIYHLLKTPDPNDTSCSINFQAKT